MQNVHPSPPALALIQRSEAARKAALVLLFGALTAVAAQLQVPTQPVPITGQVFLVLLSGALLGPRLGLLSQLAYLCIGFLGAPVFAGGKSTPLVLLGPTAGYLLAFPLAAWLAGWAAARGRSFGHVLGGMLLGVVTILLLGGVWLGIGSCFFSWSAAGVQPDLLAGLRYGMLAGALPFLPLDMVKAVVAAAVAWPLVRKAG